MMPILKKLWSKKCRNYKLCDSDGVLRKENLISKHQASQQVFGGLKLFNISKTTVKRWCHHWLAFKILLCQTSKKMRLDSNEKFRAWSVKDLRALKKLVDARPLLFVDEIQTIMTEQLCASICSALNLDYCAESFFKCLVRWCDRYTPFRFNQILSIWYFLKDLFYHNWWIMFCIFNIPQVYKYYKYLFLNIYIIYILMS